MAANLINIGSLSCDCNTIVKNCSEGCQNFIFQLAVKYLVYAYKLEDNLDKLGSTSDELSTTKDTVMEWVRQEELQKKHRTREVEGWFKKLVLQKAISTKLLEERNRHSQTMCLGGSCSTNYCSTVAFSVKVGQCLEKLTELVTTGKTFTQDGVAGSTDWFNDKKEEKSETADYQPVGLEAKREEVLRYLEKGHMVGVFGKAGVGKTTFLKLLETHYAGVSGFHVIWIKLNDSNEEMIQDAIRDEIGLLNDWRYETVEEKARYISTALQKEKFILLLDGIVQSINLQNIGVPHKDDLNGSKVVFTARNMGVRDGVKPRAEKTVSIDVLEDGEALKLFLKAAGQEGITRDSRILKHAATVAKKCGGLPHALVKIGKVMSRKTMHDEWIQIINFFQNPAKDSTVSNDLFSELRCSYDGLPDEIHKACFLYCALFPAGLEIPQDQLKELWIFGDFWIDLKDYERNSICATNILRTLIDASLLEERGEGVKMHHVFRSMALWLATQDTLVVTGMHSNDPNAESLRGMKRVSLMETDIDGLPKVPANACCNLMTLFLTSNQYLCNISPGFLRCMSKLTVLNLSHSSLEALPTDVSSLVSLNYLDISFTKITKLPSTLKKLVKLKYFNVNGLKLEFKRAKEVMSNLSCLEVLKMICSYSYGTGARQEDEKELLELKNLHNVKVLEIAVGSVPALNTLFTRRILLKKTQRLRLRGFKVSQCVDFSLSERTEKLVELSLMECGFTEFNINLESNLNRSATENNYYNITRVAVDKCDSLLHLTCLVLLPYLQVLEVSNCLQLGEIINKDKFQAIEEESEIQNPFSDLRALHLESLPQLQLISSNMVLFESLNQLKVEKCKKLTKLPCISPKVKIQLHASKAWWDAIEWEKEDDKLAFSLRIKTERRSAAR